MRTLKFCIEGQSLRKDSKSAFSGIIRGSRGYLQCSFSLSKEWANCKIAASFWRFDQEIDAAPVIGGNCTIPDNVTDYREFEVSLVGVRKGYRITTNRVRIEQEV